jgi:hypothetical protein
MRTLKPALDRITRIMAELPLDHVEGHAFSGHLDGVGVPKLMWREAAAHAGSGGERTKLSARGRAWPWSPAGRSDDAAEQRSDR